MSRVRPHHINLKAVKTLIGAALLINHSLDVDIDMTFSALTMLSACALYTLCESVKYIMQN